jgi:hypothetical protein
MSCRNIGSADFLLNHNPINQISNKTAYTATMKVEHHRTCTKLSSDKPWKMFARAQLAFCSIESLACPESWWSTGKSAPCGSTTSRHIVVLLAKIPRANTTYKIIRNDPFVIITYDTNNMKSMSITNFNGLIVSVPVHGHPRFVKWEAPQRWARQ